MYELRYIFWDGTLRMPTDKTGSEQQNMMALSGQGRLIVELLLPVSTYHEALNLGDQVECSLEGGAIVIRPLRHIDDEFSVEILKDLVSKGLSGDELVREFEAERYRVKKAAGRLLEEADRIADGVQPASRLDDIFDSED